METSAIAYTGSRAYLNRCAERSEGQQLVILRQKLMDWLGVRRRRAHYLGKSTTAKTILLSSRRFLQFRCVLGACETPTPESEKK